MILLGTASPFAIRLSISDASTSGKVSGKIYAISTVGSFIGTFLATLILIPLIGTYRTFMLFAVLLSITAVIGLLFHSAKRKYLLYLIPLVVHDPFTHYWENRVPLNRLMDRFTKLNLNITISKYCRPMDITCCVSMKGRESILFTNLEWTIITALGAVPGGPIF